MRDQVIRELMGNWGCTKEKAEELVTKYQSTLDIAERMSSLPYYPAKQIGEAAQLQYTGMLDDKETISNMDDSKSSTKTVAGWWNLANEHYKNCFIPDCLLCYKFEQYARTMNAVEDQS